MATRIVGIVNCTPDSFSDGTGLVSHDTLLDHARQLVDEGADILDIGGDSTRPGSTCPGVEEEWRRIEPVLTKMSSEIPCSVDTHHVEVARRAIESGAAFINDVSGTCSPEMAELIAKAPVSYIFMFNAHGGAHQFGEGLAASSAFETICRWISGHVARLERLGISAEKLVADPGMGAFVSRDPQVSWDILNRFGELPAPQGGLLLGCSRKGFLASSGEQTIQQRDARSCEVGAKAVAMVSRTMPTYLRVHNVRAQRAALRGS